MQYIPPRLTKGKTWYISYYVQNPETGKFKRYRIKLDRYHTVKEKLAAARNISADIEEKLALGWNPLLESKAPKAYSRLFNVLDSFLSIKDRELEGNSLRSYHSYVKMLKHWLLANGYKEDMFAISFDNKVALSYMNEIEEKKSARTYNNYLAFYHGIFNWMIEKGYIAANPFEGLKKKSKRLTKKIRRLITDAELTRIFRFLNDDNPEFLAMSLICYCCFLRPKEIVLLKCRDIDLKRQIIHISANIAKNDNESYRTIPNEIMQFIQALDLQHPDWYLFGENYNNYNFQPSSEKMDSRKIARFWNRRVRVECHLPLEVQFYSLKDTGITTMLNKGIPINQVQKQADHSSVAITALYVGSEAKADPQLKEADMLKIEH